MMEPGRTFCVGSPIRPVSLGAIASGDWRQDPIAYRREGLGRCGGDQRDGLHRLSIQTQAGPRWQM